MFGLARCPCDSTSGNGVTPAIAASRR
jgi:hypothetical protein